MWKRCEILPKNENPHLFCVIENILSTYIYNGIVRTNYGRNVLLSWDEKGKSAKMDKSEREWLFWDRKSCTLAVGMSPKSVPYRALDDG